MKKLIYTIAFTLAGLVGMAQTNQPLPPDAQPLTALTYLSPSDSTVWFYNERSSLAINVGVWADVVELFETGWTNAQIDSAIHENIPEIEGENGINVSSGGVISPVYGNTGGSVAEGNDARIINGQTAYDRGDFRDFGLGTLTNDADESPLADLNYNGPTRFVSGVASSTNAPPFGGATYLHIARTENTAHQLGFSYNSDGLAFRRKMSGSWLPWVTVWHSGNFTPPSVFSTTSNGLVPSAPSSGNLFLRRDGSWVDPQAGGGGGSNTDLSVTNRTSTTLQINSSTGSAATVPSSTTSLAGLMSSADKTKLNSLTSYSAGSGINISGGDISVDFGTTVSTAARGNDDRILNGQQAYLWGNHAGKYVPTSVSANNILEIYSGSLYDLPEGTYAAYVSTAATGLPFPSPGGLLSFSYNGGGMSQLLIGRDGNNMAFRSKPSSGEAYEYWKNIWHSGNFNPSSYAQLGTSSTQVRNNSQLDSRYLQSSDLAGYVPTARSVSTGLGLTGGGDLTTSRTLAIDLASLPTVISLTEPRVIVTNSNYTGSESRMTAGNFASTFGLATSGTGSTQVRNNSQLDARYLQSISGGSGINVSGGSTIAVDGTVVRTSGNQTLGGTKTFSSPVVVQAVTTSTYNLGSGTTVTQSNGGKQYTSLSSNRTLNLSGIPSGGEVQVEMTNTGGSDITISFTGGSLPAGVNGVIPAGKTAVFSMVKFNSTTRVTKIIF